MTVGNAENVKTTEAQIETVARALYAEAQAEALRVHPTDQPLPSFDDDEEDSRAFCLRMARSAVEVMQQAAGDEDAEYRKQLRSVLADCSEFLAGDAFEASGYPEAKELADRAEAMLAQVVAAAPPEDDPEPPKDDEDEYGPDREETDDR